MRQTLFIICSVMVLAVSCNQKPESKASNEFHIKVVEIDSVIARLYNDGEMTWYMGADGSYRSNLGDMEPSGKYGYFVIRFTNSNYKQHPGLEEYLLEKAGSGRYKIKVFKDKDSAIALAKTFATYDDCIKNNDMIISVAKAERKISFAVWEAEKKRIEDSTFVAQNTIVR
ncbi:MAG: hypothetical protein QM802_20165 [Agriterribacter sp.]